jgi:SNF2 family DNA or RNA helicase
MGWTLHAASDVILAEPDWVPGKLDQALDRVHRIGQTDAVTGHVMAAAGSLDERVLSVAVKKAKVVYEALDKKA